MQIATIQSQRAAANSINPTTKTSSTKTSLPHTEEVLVSVPGMGNKPARTDLNNAAQPHTDDAKSASAVVFSPTASPSDTAVSHSGAQSSTPRAAISGQPHTVRGAAARAAGGFQLRLGGAVQLCAAISIVLIVLVGPLTGVQGATLADDGPAVVAGGGQLGGIVPAGALVLGAATGWIPTVSMALLYSSAAYGGIKFVSCGVHWIWEIMLSSIRYFTGSIKETFWHAPVRVFHNFLRPDTYIEVLFWNWADPLFTATSKVFTFFNYSTRNVPVF